MMLHRQQPLQPIQLVAPSRVAPTALSTAVRHPPHPPVATTSAAHPLPRSREVPSLPPAPPTTRDREREQEREKEKEKPKEKAGKLTEQWQPPPSVIQRGDDELLRGSLLGEGGFARVYLAVEPNGQRKALKVISKEQLKSTKNKSKLFGEIKIHQAMQHPNIVTFEQCFEDPENVYMQLELCSNGSLLDLLRKRRRYSEPETRFYLVQLIGACEYMHSSSVIHRDLKLGNLMLDSSMNLRVGDFGLAALVKFPGERKKTICGTPNYIAPEILFDTTNGHSFEVDIWSLGVIMYTLLVGKPPFQTKEVKNIYRKIKDNNYVFPPEVVLSPEAIQLISAILTTSPSERPTLAEIIDHAFFTTGPFPSSIPDSALREAPDWQTMSVRQAGRNFHDALRKVGIEQHGAAVPKAGLEKVTEEDENQPQVERKLVKAKAVEEKEARGMEKELRQVLQPESPIADLLRSARKPLMVSPNAEPKDLLHRKHLTKTAGSSSLAREAHKENARPLSASSAGRVPAIDSESAHRRVQATATVALEAQGTVRSKSTVVQPMTTATETRPSSSSASAAVASSTRFPARELYDTTWRALHEALSVSSTAGLDTLTQPLAGRVVAPTVFITSWVDYTHKYGTAYSLTDGSAGLYFNDSTTMVLSPDKIHFDYISNRKGNVYSRRHYGVKSHPAELERKAYLLQYFEEYMAKTLLRDVACIFVDTARTKNLDFLVKYYRMKNAIVFKMSNDVLQFNFYDHTKILLTQQGSVVTFIDPDFQLQTFSLYSLFREASRLGFYRTQPFVDQDPKRAQRLQQLAFIVDKLEYCRDVLKSLSVRKAAVPTATQSQGPV